MRRPRPCLAALLLSVTVLLAACGGPSTPPAGGGGDSGGTGGGGGTPGFGVSAVGQDGALRVGGTATVTVTVTPRGGFSGPVTAELTGAPAGVSASPVTATVAGSAPVTLTLTVRTGDAAGILRVPVKVTGGAVTAQDDAFAFVYRVSTLPTGDATCAFPTCRFPAQDGEVGGDALWLMASTNTSARSTLLRTDLRSGQVTPFSTLVNDRYTDYASAYVGLAVSGPQVWTAFVNSSYAPRVIGVDTRTGTLTKVEVGDVGATVLNLVGLPDGRVAFLYHTQTTATASAVWSVGVFDPPTARTTLIPVVDSGGFAFDLKVGPDGALWTAQGYASPALVRVDPTTRAVRRFPIGVADDNLALGLAPTSDGKVWYLDSRAQRLGLLDPADGSIRRFVGLDGMGSLHPLGTDVLYVDSDPFSTTVKYLSLDGDRVTAVDFPVLVGVSGDLDGFAVGADGSLGYESSGEAYTLPAN